MLLVNAGNSYYIVPDPAHRFWAAPKLRNSNAHPVRDEHSMDHPNVEGVAGDFKSKADHERDLHLDDVCLILSAPYRSVRVGRPMGRGLRFCLVRGLSRLRPSTHSGVG